MFYRIRGVNLQGTSRVKKMKSDILIRKMKSEDLDDLYALLSDEEVMRYIEPPFSKEKTKVFLQDVGLCSTPLIYAAEDCGAFIGYVIFHPYDKDNMEIGWVLKRNVWGKGYASYLTKVLVEKAQSLGKGAVIECSPQQHATKHIAEKFRFCFVEKRDGCDVYRLAFIEQ